MRYTGPKSERPRTPFEVSILEDLNIDEDRKKALIARYRASTS